jgi:hypothetical protein
VFCGLQKYKKFFFAVKNKSTGFTLNKCMLRYIAFFYIPLFKFLLSQMDFYFLLTILFNFSLRATSWLVLVSIGTLGLCMAGLALNILIRKNGKFPETEIGKNKNMRKLGITCVKQEEMNCLKKSKQGDNAASDDCSNCIFQKTNKNLPLA